MHCYWCQHWDSFPFSETPIQQRVLPFHSLVILSFHECSSFSFLRNIIGWAVGAVGNRVERICLFHDRKFDSIVYCICSEIGIKHPFYQAMHACIYYICVCMCARMHVCMYACMFFCLYVSGLNICIYTCMFMYVCLYIFVDASVMDEYCVSLYIARAAFKAHRKG